MQGTLRIVGSIRIQTDEAATRLRLAKALKTKLERGGVLTPAHIGFLDRYHEGRRRHDRRLVDDLDMQRRAGRPA